jgi:conjugal transfer mating pair stabilization protein TraG
MESIAAIALAFIPYLSWILLKGGVSQMVHLASSIMSPAQSAASTAANERTSGNYSFGNISLDSTNGYNAQMFQQTYSGMLSHGSVGINSGTDTLTYVPGQDELYLKQSDSYLREGISRTEAFNSSLQDSLSSSQMALHESSNAVSESLTNSSNKGVGFVDAISRHLQKGENFSIQKASSAQESFQYIQNVADEYASSKGIGKDMAVRELLSGSFGTGSMLQSLGVKADGQINYQDGVSKNSSDTENARASESSAFQHHLQTVRNLSSGEVASILGSEDAKLHQDFVQSLNETESSVDQWRAAYSKQESLTNLQSYAESDNLSIHQNLNQRFVEFLKDKYEGDVGQVVDATEMNHLDPRKRQLIDEFVSDYLPNRMSAEHLSPANEVNINAPKEVSKKRFEEDKMTLMNQMSATIGHNFGELGTEISHTASRISSQGEEMQKDMNQGVSVRVTPRYEANKTDTQEKINNGLSPTQLESYQSVKSGFGSIWPSLFGSKNEEPLKEPYE